MLNHSDRNILQTLLSWLCPSTSSIPYSQNALTEPYCNHWYFCLEENKLWPLFFFLSFKTFWFENSFSGFSNRTLLLPLSFCDGKLKNFRLRKISQTKQVIRRKKQWVENKNRVKRRVNIGLAFTNSPECLLQMSPKVHDINSFKWPNNKWIHNSPSMTSNSKQSALYYG